MFRVHWSTDGFQYEVNNLTIIENAAKIYKDELRLCSAEFIFYELAIKFIYDELLCSHYLKHDGRLIELHFSDLSTYLTTSEIEYIVKKNYPEDYI